MASSDQRGDRHRSDAEAPSVGVPEADAVEQQISVIPQEDGDRFEDASQEAFEEANEADVIEQSLDAGDDDEEHR
ncbi:hypothetical protein [Nocardiopsis alkaliphila]|uniref:hypothetical protein n=1 Tax=Nocardiopsis alkaliphila TaxID=225762 RepID=UPI0003780905|nr:hypothetical protein [Nocardiopsis alkaliphila]